MCGHRSKDPWSFEHYRKGIHLVAPEIPEVSALGRDTEGRAGLPGWASESEPETHCCPGERKTPGFWESGGFVAVARAERFFHSQCFWA